MDRVDLITPPLSSVQVLALGDVKPFARVTHSTEDDLFPGFVRSAVDAAQGWTQRQLLTATFEYVADRFPRGRHGRTNWGFSDTIRLLPAPLAAVESVKYVDLDGVQQTLTVDVDYAVVNPQGPKAEAATIVALLPWPETKSCIPDAVRVRFTAGYGADATTIPEGILLGLKKGVAEAWARREQGDLLCVMLSDLEDYRLESDEFRP